MVAAPMLMAPSFAYTRKSSKSLPPSCANKLGDLLATMDAVHMISQASAVWKKSKPQVSVFGLAQSEAREFILSPLLAHSELSEERSSFAMDGTESDFLGNVVPWSS